MADAPQLPALPADIDLQAARLPRSYELAQIALSECARVDECKTWQAQAEALASYAKQLGDYSLFGFAQRIRNRAVRRAGELLEAIKAEPPGRKPHIVDGADNQLGRLSAAKDAGLSERQAVTAIRVARVPEPLFEEMTEGRSPATLTALAEVGKKLRPIPPRELPVVDLDHVLYVLDEYIPGWRRFCARHEPAHVGANTPIERQDAVRQDVQAIKAWLGAVLDAMPDHIESENPRRHKASRRGLF